MSAGEDGARLRNEVKEALESAQRIQRMAQVEAMVEKRTNNLSYLKELHIKGGYWLNSVLIGDAELKEYRQTVVPDERVPQLYALGLSLGKLLDMRSGALLVRALLQLFEEWEYAISGAAAQSMKWMLAKQSSLPYASSGALGSVEDPFRPSIYHFHGDVAYEHLVDAPTGLELDYFEVMHALCETLSLVYRKFLEEDCFTNVHIFDGVVRIDGKVKHHLINLVAKELTETATQRVQQEMASLRM